MMAAAGSGVIERLCHRVRSCSSGTQDPGSRVDPVASTQGGTTMAPAPDEAPIPRIPSSRFPPSAQSVARVRRIIADHLHDAPVACREAVVYIASELATNAVVHGGTPYVVELRLGDPVRIEVTDS